MVSCYSRNYHLWLRTKISIEGPVVPVGIVTTVPGFEGLMKSVLVISRKASMSSLLSSFPSSSVFFFNNVCTEFIVLYEGKSGGRSRVG